MRDQGADHWLFLKDGGSSGARMRAHDWSLTSLGPPPGWPQSLRTCVRLMLTTRHPIFIFWGPQSLCFFNDSYAQSMGAERRDTAMGRPGQEVWPEIWDVIGPQIEQVMAGGGATWHEDHRVPIFRDGKLDEVFWTYSYGPIDEDSAPSQVGGVLVVVNETTKKVMAARALADERDGLWEASLDVSVVIDGEGRFVAINPATTRTLGWDAAEMVGRTVFDFVLPDDVEATLGALKQATDEALPTFVNRYRHKDGGFRWLSWVAAPKGNRIYATSRDITSERIATNKLAEAQDALRQSQKMEAVGQLTGGLAHDFNNLLAGITGSLELVRRRVAEGRLADLDRYVGAGLGAAKRAAALTHRLLAFSRRQTLEPKALAVNKLVAGMEELTRRTMGPQVELEVVAGVGLWTVRADASQLENALLNLCINARDAMPNGGKLTIETANRRIDERTALGSDIAAGQYVSMCVSDNGVGMPPDVAARAFDPFFTTKPIGMGTGLGLSMIYGFAKQSGGHARIYSEVGKGTMVCVYLPRDLRGEPEAEAPGEASVDTQAESGQTVLVIDDEPTVRMFVVEVMTELGYATLEAADGVEALKVLQSDARVDLLISDVGLPGGMNGRQVADAARVARPKLKVLFITGYAENAVLSHGHLDPGMHVMTKPFELDTLARRAKELIEAS